MVKLSEGGLVDIVTGVTIGKLFKNHYTKKLYFRKSPLVEKLTTEQEEQVCWILKEINNE